MTRTETDAAMLRPATRDDEAAVAELLSNAGLPLEGVHEALTSFMVAEDAGEIVGVAGIEACGVTDEHALLRSVAVAPSWRTRGLGRALVTRVIADAEARGAKAMYLLTTTAEAYFPNFGFVVTSRDSVPDDVKAKEEYGAVCPASATVMVRASGAM